MPKIFISLILFVLSIVLGVIFLWPYYDELDKLQIKIDNIEQEIQNQDKYYEKLSSLSKELDEYQKELAKIGSALPSEFSAPSWLKFLQKIAPENGLILTAVSSSLAQPVPQRNDIKKTQSSLSLSGSYPSLKNFLKVLEKSARLIEIDSVSFSTFQKEVIETVEISKIFDFQLEVKTYSY